MSEIRRPRKAVTDFSKTMEANLRDNDHKGGWGACSNYFLLDRMFEEWLELRDAVRSKDPDKIRHEAADVANFAMMLADNNN